jgi:hypothetical protein
MDNDYQEYKKNVCQFLDNMTHTDCYEIDKLCIPENRDQFIHCVKMYMHFKFPYQGYICFNADFTKIYKTSEITLNNNNDSKSKKGVL